jgi:hypothetical protein
MSNGEGIRESDKNLAAFIDRVTFYCSLRFAEHKSCIAAGCPLAREGCASCNSHSIVEWLKKEEE